MTDLTYMTDYSHIPTEKLKEHNAWARAEIENNLKLIARLTRHNVAHQEMTDLYDTELARRKETTP